MDDPAEERELLARCRSGGEAAFAELVDRYKGLVFGVIQRAVPDRSGAEDLAQDVFLKIHRGLPYFRGDARLTTWIYRIVLNACHEERERVRRAPHRESIDDGALVHPALRRTDRAFSDLELRDRMEKALDRLPAEARVLVTAHYLGGRGYEELAEALGMPLGTLKTQLFRARRRLRELLSSELK